MSIFDRLANVAAAVSALAISAALIGASFAPGISASGFLA